MVKCSEVSNELRKERKKMKELEVSFSIERDRFNATIAAHRSSSLPFDESKIACGTGSSVTYDLPSNGPASSRDLLLAVEANKVVERLDPNTAQQMRTLDLDTGTGRVPLSIGNRKARTGTARIDTLKEQTDWQAERAGLLEELQRLRPLGIALAEMARDFSTMQHAAASETKTLSPDSHQDAPFHHVRPSTSTGKDVAALSYCDMYTLRVARKIKSSAGRDAVHNAGKINTVQAASSHDIRSTAQISNLSELGPRCSLSGRHASWVALPSISHVSVPLCKKLRRLFGDLIDAENACSQLESDLFCALDELERLNKCKEDDNEREESQQAEATSPPLLQAMHQITAAVCAVPGGWEHFFDCNTLDHRSSSRVDTGDTKGPGRQSSYPPDDNRVRPEEAATGRAPRHTGPPPLHLIPVIVSRAIAMARAFSSEVTDEKRQLSTALSDLHDAQARLIAAVEYTDCLTTELAMREKKESSKAKAFICIESNLRDDLERSNSLAHDRQLSIARLTAEVKSIQKIKCVVCVCDCVCYVHVSVFVVMCVTFVFISDTSPVLLSVTATIPVPVIVYQLTELLTSIPTSEHMVPKRSTQVDLMQRKANDFVVRQGARTKEQQYSLLRDCGGQAEEGYLNPTPRPLLTRLSPHRNKAKEMPVQEQEPHGIMKMDLRESRVPRNATSSRHDPPSPVTPLKWDRGPYLAGTPEEEDEEEEDGSGAGDGTGVRAGDGVGDGVRDPQWGDDGVCGTPDTEDSDLYCSDEEDRIGFTAGTDKEEDDVVYDEDSRYSLERVFVNQYISNSMTQPDHMSHPSAKTSTSLISGSREEVARGICTAGSNRSTDALQYHRSSSNVSSASLKSFAENKSRSRDQGTEYSFAMITSSSEPTMRFENPAQQLDNQLRKARLTFASLRDEIKSDL
jgi:hypothetical protein